MKKLLLSAAVATAMLGTTAVHAADYVIDTQGAHAFVNFKIKHLGYSWLHGRFNTFDGSFSYDSANPNASQIMVNIDTKSIDSNHAERDKHLRGGDFLNVDKFPKATFKSTSIKFDEDGDEADVTGEFTLHGVTKTITFEIDKIGEGKDPWGGYRVGFEGETSLKLADFGIDYNLGPASTHVDIGLYIEGVRK
ncbi:YceI family protein [Pseudoalteromonas sp. KG3]|uniref:YceI family protein n=1 Tax=Pseudoalteromonas prydzensis TaxID=182141 RepID=A0ABR9FI85_9GAMM|nr:MULTISPECIES: YceI family protein [Pseudoalteromonas]MBE0456512.1 YceI family protein [Pseudoalteromonas prydzensis]WKD23880.1 YceI family protein [Pseudoalteromonas sp. KG3]|eukprot:TRINITY_DN1290_c0_g2_i5.p3 TRINITY_DN1290_c0_g2~~TRINITY_DN1290_c0_g2_i5.p3  ORF type:complete len:193 (-),score=60.16 TRINITY_DN1290_c0_g2_i5:1537-2115(-)